MKVTGLDGKSYKINLTEYHNSPQDKSSLHLRAREVLRGIFSLDVICEEVYLPGCKTKLYLDFYLPLRKFGVEVQGAQHYRFVGRFHGTDHLNFNLARQRDLEKRQWCELNNILLVEFPYDETGKEWHKRLMKSLAY